MKAWRSFAVGGLALVILATAALSIVRQWSTGRHAAAVEGNPQRAAASRQKDPALPELAIERTEGRKARIAPVFLSWRDGRGNGGVLEGVEGYLPLAPNIDAAWSHGYLFLMKEKGQLDLVWAAENRNDRFAIQPGSTAVCFDGRFLWALLLRESQFPLLVVVEVETGQTRTISVDEGLPLAESFRGDFYHHPVLGPISPGKVCLAYNSAGTKLVLAEFDPGRGFSFKPFWPAEGATPKAAGSAPSARPIAVFNLTLPAAAKGAAHARICVCLDGSGQATHGDLVVDPQSLTVEASGHSSTSLPINNRRIGNLQGGLYWLSNLSGQTPQVVLMRAALPRLEEEFLFKDMPDGKPVPYGEGLVFLGERCWFWQPGERRIEALDVQVPWLFRSEIVIDIQAKANSPPGWQLEQAFVSQHYGVLAKAVKKTGPNAYSSESTLYQFALSDDPRAVPNSSPTAEPPKLAIELPPGTSGSELHLFAREERPRAALSKTVESSVDESLRYPVLAREIVRQALLIAARDQLQWDTRDEELGEAAAAEAEPAARLVLATSFKKAGTASFQLQLVEAENRARQIWNEQLVLNETEDGPLDYARLVAAAERWSREAFPPLLAQGSLEGEPGPLADEASLSPAAAEWLKHVSFTAQFAVVRELHRALRRGESDRLVGALARAYAHLGVLSEFHWNSMHKAFKARALLYAERLVARHPKSPQALWHRALARSLSGLHDSAVSDLEAAEKLLNADEPVDRPNWVNVIDAYSRFDTDKLAALAEGGEDAAFATLLRFFHVESLKESVLVQTLAQALIERNPEDFRLLDAMCDSCAIGTLHVVTELAPAVLHQVTPARLRQLSAMPRRTEEMLRRPAGSQANLDELIDSLCQAPDGEDEGDFSWRVLGQMLEETEFIQLWRRAYFMRFQWSVPVDEFLQATAGLATRHRFRPLIELCSSDRGRWSAAAESVLSRVELEQLDYPQQRAFEQALGQIWKLQSPDQYLQAERRPALHVDDIHRDLLRAMQHQPGASAAGLMHRLLKVSSRSPDTVAARIAYSPNMPKEELAALEQKFAGDPQFWKALGPHRMAPWDYQRVLRQYIKLSPDTWAYKALVETLRREGKLDEWKTTIDECLQQPSFGLDHAQLQVQVANFLMDKGQWQDAQPYAEEAAETWAEWAMLAAIRCYQGLQDDEREGIWRERIAERYPSLRHSLDLYVWARRSGRGDAVELSRTIEPQIAAAAERTNAESQYMVGLYYQMSKRPREALAAYQKGLKDARDSRTGCFNGLWVAALSQETGDAKTRDEALQRVANTSDRAVAHFGKLATWLQSLVASEAGIPDLSAVRELVNAAPPNDRTGLNAFVGRFLDLRGHKEDAETFYRCAVAEPEGRFSATRSFVCAVLRDRGLDPHQP